MAALVPNASSFEVNKAALSRTFVASFSSGGAPLVQIDALMKIRWIGKIE